MYSSSPLFEIKLRVIIFEVDRIVEEKRKVENSQAAKSVSVHMPKTAYPAMSAGLKDISCQYIEKILTKVTLKSTLDYLFKKNIQRWSQASGFIKPFKLMVRNSKTVPNALATFA